MTFALLSPIYPSVIVTCFCVAASTLFVVDFGPTSDFSPTSVEPSLYFRAGQAASRAWKDRCENVFKIYLFTTLLCELLGVWPAWLWPTPLFLLAILAIGINVFSKEADADNPMRWRVAGGSVVIGLLIEVPILLFT